MAPKIKKKAKTAKRRTKAKSTKSAADEGQEAGRYDHVQITDQDVVLIQVKENGRVDVKDVVFQVFDSESKRWQDGAAWLAFHKSDVPHHAGLSTWIGLNKSMPSAVIDMIQTVLHTAGMEVGRDMGRAVHLDLNPFARLSHDGLEILVPAALVGDPSARRVIDRGGVNAIARGYTVALSKAAALNQLFFGSDE